MKRLKANRLSHLAYGKTYPTPKQAASYAAFELEQLTKTVKEALDKGSIRAIGGTVYGPDMGYICSTTDLYPVIRALNQQKVKVGRTDSGGAPTWAIEG